MKIFNSKIFYSSLILFLILIFSFNNISKFKLDASSDTLILQNDESFKFFNYYNNIFPTKNFLVLAIKSEQKIDKNYINVLNKLQNELLKINGIESTFSIIDAPILLLNNIDLTELQSKKIQTINNSDYNLDDILEEFSNSPIFQNQIINKTKTTSSIIIFLKKDNDFTNIKNIRNEYINNNLIENKLEFQKIQAEYFELKSKYNENRKKIIIEIRKLLKEELIPYKHFLGGIDMIADDTLKFIKSDIIIFSIFVIFFIFAVLFFIFRNLKWVLIPIISTTYSIICVMGLLGFLNWQVTAISSNFISLMLILSISMCIHIINNYKNNYNQNNIYESIMITIKKMFWPCFYTALTTIVAFASLLFSDIKPVIDFGKIMILGLMIILFSSFTVLPTLIYLFPQINKNDNINFSILNKFYLISSFHRIKIYLINITIFIISLLGIYNLSVENSFINYFKKDTEIYKGMKIIDDELGGTTPLDIIIQFKNDDFINQENNLVIDEDLNLDEDLELNDSFFSDNINNENWFNEEKISTIKSIHNYLESQNEIGKVQSIYSLIDMAELINKNELSVFELSILYKKIPDLYKEDLILPYLSIENNMTKISARIKDSKDIKRQELINRINNHVKKNYKNSIDKVNVNGLMVLYNNMLQSLFDSQIKSFGLVLISIFVMFLILFRSFILSIIGIIPNILASTFIIGFIGLVGIPLDIMTITIAAITIGIAVDNTIHYLYKTKENLKTMDIYESIKQSHKTVGRAVLTTSLTIAFGFSVLCLSNFIPTILFGIFTALAMIIAMLGVLITLPAGLLILKK